MPNVELLFFPDCPNVSAARDQLRRAFAFAGVSPTWSEIDVTSDAAPAHARGHGSPTILVAGEDVSGETRREGCSCRVYLESEDRRVPPLEAIVAALRAADAGERA